MAAKKIIIKVGVSNEKGRIKAMKIAAVAQGVSSVSMEGDGKDQVVVTGEGVDSVNLVNKLRKKLGHATIVSVQDVKEEEKKKKNGEWKPIEIQGYYCPYPPAPSYERVVYDPYPHNSCSLM